MVEWRITDGLVPYEDALNWMEARVERIHAGEAPECIWLLQHPALYTAGTSAKPEDLVDPGRLPVHQTRRGGQYTYHGPGQRVVYTMLDLNRRGRDVRRFVHTLEDWVIVTLAEFQVRAERRAGRVGVWVSRPEKPPAPDGSPAEAKIAAIGVRIRRWVSFHGLSIIIPVTMADLDIALQRSFSRTFGAPSRRGWPRHWKKCDAGT